MGSSTSGKSSTQITLRKYSNALFSCLISKLKLNFLGLIIFSKILNKLLYFCLHHQHKLSAMSFYSIAQNIKMLSVLVKCSESKWVLVDNWKSSAGIYEWWNLRFNSSILWSLVLSSLPDWAVRTPDETTSCQFCQETLPFGSLRTWSEPQETQSACRPLH